METIEFNEVIKQNIEVVGELKKISGNDFDKWFYVLEFSSVDEETLSVKVPTRAFASILTEQYSETLYAALSLAYGERKLKFVL